jgi:hypothetical protein
MRAMIGSFSLLVAGALALSPPSAAQGRVDVTPFVGIEPQATLFPTRGAGVPCVETLPGENTCPATAVSQNAAFGFGARLTEWSGLANE